MNCIIIANAACGLSLLNRGRCFALILDESRILKTEGYSFANACFAFELLVGFE